MPLTDRTKSTNIYAFSNIWYTTAMIDLRKGDEEKINSIAKSFIYQDSLEKPEELILYRPESDGGLGLEHIGLKAQASKIKNFI